MHQKKLTCATTEEMHRTAMKLATSLRLKPTTLEVEQPNTVKARGRVRVGEGVRGESERGSERGGGVRGREAQQLSFNPNSCNSCVIPTISHSSCALCNSLEFHALLSDIIHSAHSNSFITHRRNNAFAYSLPVSGTGKSTNTAPPLVGMKETPSRKASRENHPCLLCRMTAMNE